MPDKSAIHVKCGWKGSTNTASEHMMSQMHFILMTGHGDSKVSHVIWFV